MPPSQYIVVVFVAALNTIAICVHLCSVHGLVKPVELYPVAPAQKVLQYEAYVVHETYVLSGKVQIDRSLPALPTVMYTALEAPTWVRMKYLRASR